MCGYSDMLSRCSMCIVYALHNAGLITISVDGLDKEIIEVRQPGTQARSEGKRAPGTHCLCMRLIALTFHGFSISQ